MSMNATMAKQRPAVATKKKVTFVHNQYNSPLNLYSDDEVAQTLRRHASLLSNGAVGWVWFRENYTSPNYYYIMTKANVATLCKDLYKRTYVKYRTSKRQLIKCIMQKKTKTKSGFDLGRQCAPGGITNGRRKMTFKKLSVCTIYTTEKERKDTILLIIHSLLYPAELMFSLRRTQLSRSPLFFGLILLFDTRGSLWLCVCCCCCICVSLA